MNSYLVIYTATVEVEIPINADTAEQAEHYGRGMAYTEDIRAYVNFPSLALGKATVFTENVPLHYVAPKRSNSAP